MCVENKLLSDYVIFSPLGGCLLQRERGNDNERARLGMEDREQPCELPYLHALCNNFPRVCRWIRRV